MIAPKCFSVLLTVAAQSISNAREQCVVLQAGSSCNHFVFPHTPTSHRNPTHAQVSDEGLACLARI